MLRDGALDEDLRPAIDRLVANGGRLTIHAGVGADPPGAAVVVLDQLGVRFGILEVRGAVTVPGGAVAAGTALQSSGWTDPTVTHRLGREIRLRPAESSHDEPANLTRTWRVPPALSSEIADHVRDALGVVGRIQFVPLESRERAAADPAPALRAASEERELEPDRTAERRAAGRNTLPAPVKAILALALVGAIVFLWAGMIRGAPRLQPTLGQPASTPIAGGAPARESATPAAPTPALVTTTPGPIRSKVANASTEDGSGPASAAIDGDPVTAWHAAFGVPQWIEISLDAPYTVKEVTLLIAQSKTGTSRHMIQVAVTGQALQVVGIVDRRTADGDPIVFRPETPIENVERIRIETMATPSNAGWYEVIVR
jgi:F5/8 type C domain-containing protein